MATKQARGTKRTCQSSECDARFYDLSRSPIVCPVCGTLYELASSPLGAAPAASEERAARRSRKSDFSEKTTEDAEDTDEAAEVEDGEDESISTDEDETFLEEEEEEGGDVSNIIGGAVKEGGDER